MSKRAHTLQLAEVEALLSGTNPDGCADVAELLGRFREDFGTSPPPTVAHRHLAAMRDAARVADQPVGVPPHPSARRRLRLVSRPLAVLATSGMVLAGGMAATATGRLPEPVQSTATKALEAVGFDVSPDPQPQAAPVVEMAICQQVAAAVRDRVAAGLAVLSGQRPDLAEHLAGLRSDLPATIGSGHCAVGWDAVARACPPGGDSPAPSPPTEELAASPPEPLWGLVATPCAVDWAGLDWTAVFSAVAPADVVRWACARSAMTAPADGAARARQQRFAMLCANGFDPGRWPVPAERSGTGNAPSAPSGPTPPNEGRGDWGGAPTTDSPPPGSTQPGTWGGDGSGPRQGWGGWDGQGTGSESEPGSSSGWGDGRSSDEWSGTAG